MQLEDFISMMTTEMVNDLLNSMFHCIALRLLSTTFVFLAVSFIGLEANAYTASEDDGVVQVCVQVFYPTVETPIGFPFSLTIETFDEDTGEWL